LKITNDKINELLDEIYKSKQICDSLKKENEKVNTKLKVITERVRILEKTNKDIEESLTVTQDIQDKKVCELEKKMKNKNSVGEEEKNKLRQLEDRLRRNNLRIDGLPENDQETWDQTEKKLLILFENELNIRNVDIERAHRVGKKEETKTRTIVAKILHYKDKIKVLHSSNRLKGTGIYINEDFSYETTVIRKKLVEEMKIHRKNGKYSSINYDKLIVREFRKNQASA
jgi:hypothetical protein